MTKESDKYREILVGLIAQVGYTFKGIHFLRNRKHFLCFDTVGSLGEREIKAGTRARRASLSLLFRVLPNFYLQVFV